MTVQKSLTPELLPVWALKAPKMDLRHPPQQRDAALARWENEGGAPLRGPHRPDKPMEARSQFPVLTPAEWEQLRLRVIAIENLLITILAGSSDRERKLARAMAQYISPRPGFTPHHLTVGAASQMVRLVDRASHFQGSLAEDHD